VAAKVDTIGHQIVQANAQLGLKPTFATLGAPQPEIFHRSKDAVIITEALAKQCTTDGQLAAVLCHELGVMVAEREALAGPRARVPDLPPPIQVAVGNDLGGSIGAPDQLHRAEMGRYEKERHEREAAAVPPDPTVLARAYLVKAGFVASDLDAVAPLLRAAAENRTFAKQVSATPPTK
jgi:hypothetical protein